jgi:hypothetical protein
MKRIALFAGLAFAFAAPSFAQDVPQTTTPDPAQTTTPEPATTPEPEQTTPPMVNTGTDALHTSGMSTKVYHGPHRYPMREKGHRPGDPPIIDHSADTLIVEPTHSTVTVTAPAKT